MDFVSSPDVHFWERGIPLYYYDAREEYEFTNFGDMLAEKIVERMVGHPINVTFNTSFRRHNRGKKFLSLGSIFHYVEHGDVVWGSGVHGWFLDPTKYDLVDVDIRAVRGPLTRDFLVRYDVPCPAIYGDPALLLPRLFPEFKRAENPRFEYIIIPHLSDSFFCLTDPDVVSPRLDWEKVVRRILDSKFVISASLHGIIVAEAFGIPARYLRISDQEPIFKYMDYYAGTGRPDFQFATSVEEAIEMGGERPFKCDLDKLYNAFPFDWFPRAKKK